MIAKVAMRISTLLLALLPCYAWTQTDKVAPAVEMTPTSRIYYPEQMGFPGNTPVLDVMLAIIDGRASMPEEIVRNYAIKLDGAYIKEDLIVFLSNLRVNEIAKISYNNNQTVTEGAQGLLGSISITSKAIDEGVTGFADMSVTSGEDSRNTVRVKMHHNHWEASGQVSWRMMGVNRETESVTSSSSTNYSMVDKINGDRFLQDAYLRAQYNGDKDLVMVLITQQYGHKSGNETFASALNSEHTGLITTLYNNRNRQLNFNLVWDHAFTEKTHFEGFFLSSFSNNPSVYTDDYEGKEWENFRFSRVDYDFSPKTTTTYGEIRFSCREVKNLYMVGGADYSFDNFHTGEMIETNIQTKIDQDFCTHSSLLSPHFDATYQFGRVTLSSGYRINVLKYEAKLGGGNHWSHMYYNPMWSSFVSWNITSRNKVLASYSHRIKEQDVTQMFPQTIISVDDHVSTTMGDENLKLPTFDIFDVSYAHNSEHVSLLLKGRYYHGRNELSQINDRTEDSFGVTYDYNRWVNSNDVKGVNLDAELYLRYGLLKTTIAAAYNRLDFQDSDMDAQDSWMIRLQPVLTLPYGFNFAGALSYHTQASTPTLHYKDYWYGRMRINKDINEHWSLYAQWDNPLRSKIVTTSYENNQVKRVMINEHDSHAVFGIFYAF